ncbi:MAG: SIS domain-containing protein [Phyllobacteriaceae bacterium]|jgi:glucosamine--fructose-6-phosphate aminotransferase (isomerizing)|nr:SIS domain-containing protein [Phyllobacteriaceae bacterium]
MGQIIPLQTQMAREIAEIPHAVQRFIDQGLDRCIALGQSLRDDPPPAILTCARGTSDQAALYFKYLVESRAGIPVASLGPSVSSVYGASLHARNMVCLTVSQSGGSPDLVELQRAAASGGARIIALLNTLESPVGRIASDVIDLKAGREEAVAATKSFVCSLVAIAAIVGAMTENDALLDGIRALPATLDTAIAAPPANALKAIAAAPSVLTVSRGPAMAAAGEAALKLKETCQFHAEAYSAAEIMHGPSVLAGRGVAVLAFVPDDAGRASVVEACQAMQVAGAPALRIDSENGDIAVPTAAEAALTPIIQIAAFYRLVETLSVQLGCDPDHPPGLSKVTKTV